MIDELELEKNQESLIPTEEEDLKDPDLQNTNLEHIIK